MMPEYAVYPSYYLANNMLYKQTSLQQKYILTSLFPQIHL